MKDEASTVLEGDQAAVEQLKMHEVAEVLLGAGSWIADLAKGQFTLSKGWQKVHGITRRFLSMEELMPIAFPDDRPQINAAFANCVKHGDSYHLTHRIVRQDDGEVRTINAYAEVMETDEGGHAVKLFGMVQDITDQVRAEEKLKFQATHDDLTGLAKRAICLDRIALAISSARRNKRMAAVLFVDLDGFKAVNDTLGHDAGDTLLRSISKRLVALIRDVDSVARVGGDEFVVVLSDMDRRHAAELVARKILAALTSPVEIDGHATHVGASIGIVVCPNDSDDPDEALRMADSAMYAVKMSGKNNVGFWGDESVATGPSVTAR